nr:expressed protein [Hymenolepis microstoma]
MSCDKSAGSFSVDLLGLSFDETSKAAHPSGVAASSELMSSGNGEQRPTTKESILTLQFLKNCSHGALRSANEGTGCISKIVHNNRIFWPKYPALCEPLTKLLWMFDGVFNAVASIYKAKH